MTRDPPESTTVKAPLSAVNLADSSAARLASSAARSSSASNMISFFLDAASPAAAWEATAETGARGEWDDDDRSLQRRDRRSGAGTQVADEDRRGMKEEREVDAAAGVALEAASGRGRDMVDRDGGVGNGEDGLRRGFW